MGHTLESSFGRDLSGVLAHYDDEDTKVLLSSAGVPAACEGAHVWFENAQPTVEVAAHEVAHALQAAEPAAPTGDAGMAEQDADAAADAAVRGEAADVAVGSDGGAAGWGLGDLFDSVASTVSKAVVATVDAVVHVVDTIVDSEPDVEPVFAQPTGATTPSLAQGGGVGQEEDTIHHFAINGVAGEEAAQSPTGELSGAQIDSTTLGNVVDDDVELNFNPSRGLVNDLAECGEGKFLGIPGEGVRDSATEYYDALLAGETVAITAHSQGAIQTNQSLTLTYAALVEHAKAEGMANPEGWASTTMNQNVEVLLLGPGLSGKNFAPMLDQANITSITDESDLVSEMATITSPGGILGVVPTAVDVAEVGVDTLRNTARFFWEAMKDPSETHDPMTILTGEHSMQNYLQEHADEVEEWNEAVLAEHGK